jgi:Protein of unknown function with HXXEE motif
MVTTPEVRSWILGTAALWVMLGVAGALAARRPMGAATPRQRRRVVVWGVVALAGQCAHFAEEYRGAFYNAFPRVLGLAPWGSGFFVTFNLAWLAIWVWAVVSVARGGRLAAWPLWFLGCALVANGVAHPLLSLMARGYFPGLVSAPFVGVAGIMLLRALANAHPPPGSLLRGS